MKKNLFVLVLLCSALLVSETVLAKDTKAKNSLHMIKPYQTDITVETEKNKDFRRVLFTGLKSQLVVMNIPKGGEVGEENHAKVEQIFFIEKGSGKSVLNGIESKIEKGDVVVVPPGNTHNIINTGLQPLKIYTVYSPPNHIDGTIHKTKLDAEKDTADEAFGKEVK